MCNRMVCTTHVFQLSVWTLLATDDFKKLLDKVTTFVRSFRKLSVTLGQFKRVSDSSRDFKVPLRPFHDVSTL